MVKEKKSESFDFIPYGRQWVNTEDCEAVGEVLQSAYLTTGPEAAKFEKSLCDLTGARYAVTCANGTAVLHLACLSWIHFTGCKVGNYFPQKFRV